MPEPSDTWRTVLLRHQIPDGSSHIDWMLEPTPVFPADEPGRLLTFQAARPLFELDQTDSMPLRRLADHREAYLAHEGPISGNRGHVTRIASGVIDRFVSDAAASDGALGRTFDLEVRWSVASRSEDLRQRFTLRHRESDQWSLICTRRGPACRSDCKQG